MTGPRRRVVARHLYALAAALGMSSCTSQRDSPRDSSTLTVLYIGDETIFAPTWEMPAKFLVFLPLVETNERGETEGRLAKRWSHSADFREWTFHLRQDVRWHDGVPVTAQDVAFTLDLLKHPALGWAAPDANHVRVVNDSTLTVAYHDLPMQFPDDWTVVWPKHLLERLDPRHINTWDFWVRPVGDGPYRYVRNVPKTMVELEANPDFYRGAPRIQRVVLKFGGGTPIVELLSGDVDVITYVNEADLPRIAADPRFRIYQSVNPLALVSIFWNHRRPLFDNPMVRRALTLAIDRRELLRVMNLPQNLQVADVLFTARQYWRHQLPAPLPYDPDSASHLLDAAGWRGNDRNGVRERGGREFRFVALVAPGTVEARAAVYVQAQLQRVGVHMDVQTLEVNLINRRLRGGDFEAVFFGLFNSVDSVDGHLLWFGERSPIGYANPRVIDLLRTAGATADPERIDCAYRSLMPVFGADLPLTVLFPRVSSFVARRRLQGLGGPVQADPTARMEHLWLENGP